MKKIIITLIWIGVFMLGFLYAGYVDFQEKERIETEINKTK